MADAFKIITSRLLLALVCGNRRIPCSTCQILPFFEGNVLTLAVAVTFCESEVYDEDLVTG